METVLLMLCLNLEGVVMVSSVNNPFFSVVIPVYNSEKYLDKCISSMLVPEVLDQLEIIVVNDGSKDATVAVAQEYCHRYPNTVRLIRMDMSGTRV